MAVRKPKSRKNKLFIKTKTKTTQIKEKQMDSKSDISGVYGVLATGFNKNIKMIKPVIKSKKRKNSKIKKNRKTSKTRKTHNTRKSKKH
jgi:hypothetical protein